ncbi:MAG TPA: hypothetical protein DCQ98_15640 [Planctomycetaceae bacterium]|nr:hypothetical protein [Planctomycetaceae bacterium]
MQRIHRSLRRGQSQPIARSEAVSSERPTGIVSRRRLAPARPNRIAVTADGQAGGGTGAAGRSSLSDDRERTADITSAMISLRRSALEMPHRRCRSGELQLATARSPLENRPRMKKRLALRLEARAA